MKITNDNGLVIAPAGFGKTEDIVSQTKKILSEKMVLILTHTNIGVEEILNRLKSQSIDNNKVNVMTIASFSLKYIKCFPIISGYVDNQESFDKEIYKKMSILLDNKHVKEIIQNTYSYIFVDEYQDCNILQHQMIKKICEILDYKIYGDPLQSLFNFDGDAISFKEIINKDYKLVGALNYPWRWEKYNKHLGKWIFNIRKKILNNEEIKLLSISNYISFIKTDNLINTIRQVGYNYISKNISNVILTRLEHETISVTKQFAGKYKMQDDIECKLLKEFCKKINLKEKKHILVELFKIIKSSYSGTSIVKNVIDKINAFDYNLRNLRTNKDLIKMIEDFINCDTINFNILMEIISYIESIDKINKYRYDLINILKKLLINLSENNDQNVIELLHLITSNRNQTKFKYTISRVLLVKGLQFDNVIIISPEKMTKEEFYVAISRATKSITIISEVSLLKFS